jgi:hypothetical protein
MLAYLDDILEPDDTEDIGKKIDESEFATSLVQRTRECMRRPRLGVPSLLGRGLGADPNSVAEYLDNTLAPERVGEFEKICLESDVHLAEVACSHQILTLVLGEPAEIDPEMRARAYRLAAEYHAPPVQSDAPRPQAAAGAPAIPPRSRVKPEVPEYLRESSNRWWPLAAMILIAALLTFGGLMLFGPADLRDRAVALVTGNSEAEGEEAAVSNAPGTANNAPGTAQAPAQPAAQAAVSTPSAATAPAEAARSEQPQVTTPPAGEPAAESPSTPETDSPPAAETADGEPRATEAATPTTEEMADDEPAAAAAADTPAADKAVPAEPENENVGRYTSKRDVLLALDPADKSWKRLKSMTPLSKGDRLLALPLFRPTVTLTSNVTIQAEGASLFELSGWNEQGAPIIDIEFGRLLMATVGKPTNTIDLKLGEQRVQLTFADADATLAIEVRRVLPPGKDPEEGLSPLVADLYATSGTVQVREGEKLVPLQAPATRTLFGPQQSSAGEFPKWVGSEALSASEREAINALEPAFDTDQPAATILKNFTDSQHSIGRRREVRALATRSLVYLGDFEPCIAALNDTKEKLSWPTYLEEMRLAITRSPETAAQVRATFQKQRGADAPFLYRMLWGYTAADLKNGADKDLIAALDNDALDYRVMSFWNLQNITGSGHHGYRPEDPTNKRRTPYNAWKDKLRQGKILPAGATGKSKAAAKSG